MKLKLEPGLSMPLYKQLVTQIQHAVSSGKLLPGQLLPSLNDLSAEAGISKETVKKAYGILLGRGVIGSKQGKGYYVSDPSVLSKPRVLLVFDKLSIYKQLLYNSFEDTIGDHAELTILTHNQSVDLLEFYLDNNLDQFDYYVITPHFPLEADVQARVNVQLSRIPNRKLILLDRLQPGFSGNFGAVYQDFDNDIYHGLMQGVGEHTQSHRMRVIILPQSLYGNCIRRGVERFCQEMGMDVEFYASVPEDISVGDTFLVLNSQLDDGIVALSRRIKALGLSIGQDVRIISYNEFDMNELILGGLTTVSADFRQMGRYAAEMILNRRMDKIHCDFRMTRRSTF